MLVIPLRATAKFDNLDDVQAKFRSERGSIVLYHDVWSLVALSVRTPRLVHVAPGESRISAGLRTSRRTLWAGWFAVSGPPKTCAALAHNFRGGLDVSFAFAPPGVLAEHEIELAKARYIDEATAMKRWVIAGTVFGFGVLFGSILIFAEYILPRL